MRIAYKKERHRDKGVRKMRVKKEKEKSRREAHRVRKETTFSSLG